ncbi:unnamed protein product [Soboliphyme baturini]|uniref:dCMP deaminase n=1 Tax=Soboliphyme baturini TaxID=241478 RepID=A0A183J1E6_9BILA|nr:unnamed protein product [Soboliphyme baturini]
MPTGCSDDLLPWADCADDMLNTKHPYMCHAAMNAILNQNVPDISGSTLYVTRFPCVECVKLIIQAGINSICYLRDDHTDIESEAARYMLDMCKVSYKYAWVI